MWAARRRYEQQLRTSWQRVVLRQGWERHYSAAEEGMQVLLPDSSRDLVKPLCFHPLCAGLLAWI